MDSYLPDFKYELFNVSSSQMDKVLDIKTNLLLQSSLLVMSKIMKDAKKALEEALKVYKGQIVEESNQEELLMVLNYLVVSGNIEKEDLKKSLETLEQGDLMPTLAQKWLIEGKI